ncbi:hypothetical protein L1049_022473 [Liquidambar formosana]|uniref:Uncharacterized protein n=1 Tax=Liquidambar formosana TaxID=63359 RepID=A0AAP0RCK8_LIQFO
MEHCIFIPDPTKHCINKDGALHHYSNLAQRIKKNIDQLPPLYPESCICRVHKRLRDVNPKAYTPIVISIGPYHHGKEGLHAMEEHKLRSLQSFLKRRVLIDMEWYLSKLAELEDTARKFYADPIDLNSEEFVAMMLLDGCFIIEFLREGFPGCVGSVIRRDMILLENQLPYFVLSQLYDTNKDSKNGEPLENMASEVFECLLLPNSTFRFEGSNDTQEIKHLLSQKKQKEIKHLLHLLQVLCSPLSDETSTESDITSTSQETEKQKSMARKINVYQIRSAVELRDAGVKFKKVDKGIFDIKFENGLMEVPFLSVDDFTETWFRNLVAYEQHSLDGKPEYFTDYITFMDQLINSEKDVNLLRLKGIIDNLLGDDQEVCKLFNGLGDGVICSPSDYSCFSEVYEKVNDHCEKPWNQKKAKLRHNYFNSPWAGDLPEVLSNEDECKNGRLDVEMQVIEPPKIPLADHAVGLNPPVRHRIIPEIVSSDSLPELLRVPHRCWISREESRSPISVTKLFEPDANDLHTLNQNLWLVAIDPKRILGLYAVVDAVEYLHYGKNIGKDIVNLSSRFNNIISVNNAVK